MILLLSQVAWSLDYLQPAQLDPVFTVALPKLKACAESFDETQGFSIKFQVDKGGKAYEVSVVEQKGTKRDWYSCWIQTISEQKFPGNPEEEAIFEVQIASRSGQFFLLPGSSVKYPELYFPGFYVPKADHNEMIDFLSSEP